MRSPSVLGSRIGELLPLPLLAGPPVGEGEERAFDAYLAEQFVPLALLGTAVIMAATLGWWPTDRLFLPDPATIAAFSRLRTNGALVEGTAFVVFIALRKRPRTVALLAFPFYALLLGVLGEAIGTIGSAGIVWFANAIIGVVPATLAPLRPGPRIVATTALTAALPLGFFAAHPENLALAAAPGQLSFCVFALLLTLALGEASYRLTRRAFLDRRSTDLANARLAELSAGLAETVEARTAELRALALHLDTAREAERRRIAHELHDELGQELAAMRYTLARLADRVGGAVPAAVPLVEDLDALLDGASRTVRGFVSTLRPRVLDDLGLVAAGEWLAEQVQRAAPVRCTLASSPAVRAASVSSDASLVLYRVLQESTTNAIKHAGASWIALGLDVVDGGVIATAEDDGRGFDPGAPRAGFGLLGLEERVRASGGAFTVDAAPGRGTRVRAWVPLGGG